MPQLIPVAIGYAATALAGAAGLGTVGATLGITALNSITWASVIGTAVGIGSSFALSAVMGGGGGQAEQAAQDRKHMVRGTAEPRQVIYGTARVSGSLVYAGSSGPNKEFLHLVMPVATHKCRSIGTIWLNGTPAEPHQFDASGMLVDTAHPMHGRVRITRIMGDQTTAPSNLMAESLDGHTINHVIFGACYLYIRLQYDPERLPNIPTVECLVEGRDDIWDPRSNTTGFSNNWALCILNYLRWQYGLRTPLDLIDQPSFIAAANLSDELVQISAGGEQQSRYLLDGAFKLSEDTLPVDVLQRMLDAGAGGLYRVAGRFRLYGGAYRAPTGTINASDLTGKVQIVPRHSRSQLFNGVKVTFIDPARDWGAHPGSPVSDPAMVAEDGGFQLWRELDLPFVTNRTRAERIARIKLLEHRDGLTIHTPVKFSSIRFCLGQYISFSDPRAGMDGKVFEITDWKFDPNGMGVILVLEERAPFNYAWNFDLAYSGAPAPNTTLVNPLSVPTPAAPSLAQVLTINADGQSVPAIAATWTPPAFPFLTGMDVEFRRAGGQWQSQFVPAGVNRLELWPLISGTVYEFRLRARSQFVPSAASSVASIAAPADTLAPAMPTGLVATPAPGGGALAWNMNSDADLDRYRVWERPGPTDAWTLIAETYSNRYLRTNLPAGTTRRFAISAVDLTGNEGLRCTDAVLVAGSLPTTDLSGQIETPQLADFAVTARVIASDAVPPRALLMTPGNICPDPFFDDFGSHAGGQFWQPDAAGWYAEEPLSASYWQAGMGVRRSIVLWDGVGIGTARRHVWSRPGRLMPASAHQQYRLRAKARSNANQTIQVGLAFYDWNYALLGLAALAWTSADDVVAGVPREIPVTAPAGSAMMRVVVWNDGGTPYVGLAMVADIQVEAAVTASMVAQGSAVITGAAQVGSLVVGTGAIIDESVTSIFSQEWTNTGPGSGVWIDGGWMQFTLAQARAATITMSWQHGYTAEVMHGARIKVNNVVVFERSALAIIDYPSVTFRRDLPAGTNRIDFEWMGQNADIQIGNRTMVVLTRAK